MENGSSAMGKIVLILIGIFIGFGIRSIEINPFHMAEHTCKCGEKHLYIFAPKAKLGIGYSEED